MRLFGRGTRRQRLHYALHNAATTSGNALPHLQKWPRLADADTWARIMSESTAPMLAVPQFGFGRLLSTHPDAEGEYLPILSLGIAPGSGFDFAHPETGFRGLFEEPPHDLVMRVWADDLLTITHGHAWQLVVDGVEPFDRWWIKSVFPERGPQPAYVAVTVQFDSIPNGQVPREELAAAPSTLVHVEDRRPTLVRPSG